MDWSSDPELNALRQEFVDSFRIRIIDLAKCTSAEAVGELSHKLAGVAGNYGFPTITEIAGSLEDIVLLKRSIQEILPFKELLDQAMNEGLAGVDPVHLQSDPRLKVMLKIISDGESSLFESKP